MKQKDSGLTVGELTIAIGALIIAGILWSTFNQSRDPKEQTNAQYNSVLVSKQILVSGEVIL